MKDSDYSTLLQKATEGDINAFEKLFAEFQPQLKSYLYRLLTDRNDVDDIAHDTFIKAYDKLETFKGKSSLKPGFFTLVPILHMISCAAASAGSLMRRIAPKS